ncbi:hypothetical protein N9B54_03400 [Mariniblastus sp.]|nr:hypothetical protein [Mariniblastus sp.]MDB4490125.1 hypothetical protein [bacterium]
MIVYRLVEKSKFSIVTSLVSLKQLRSPSTLVLFLRRTIGYDDLFAVVEVEGWGGGVAATRRAALPAAVSIAAVCFLPFGLWDFENAFVSK